MMKDVVVAGMRTGVVHVSRSGWSCDGRVVSELEVVDDAVVTQRRSRSLMPPIDMPERNIHSNNSEGLYASWFENGGYRRCQGLAPKNCLLP